MHCLVTAVHVKMKLGDNTFEWREALTLFTGNFRQQNLEKGPLFYCLTKYALSWNSKGTWRRLISTTFNFLKKSYPAVSKLFAYFLLSRPKCLKKTPHKSASKHINQILLSCNRLKLSPAPWTFTRVFKKIETTMRWNCVSKALRFLQITAKYQDCPGLPYFWP